MSKLSPQHHQHRGDFCSLFSGSGSSSHNDDDHNSRISSSNSHYNEHIDDVDLAKEMNELSVQEREEVYADIHGVAQVPEETLELQTRYLKELDEALEKTAKAKRKAYDRVLFFKPTIQNDVELKMMFLRAEHYSAKKAAERMMRYFEGKRSLFGEEKLAKKITLDDLDAQDIEILNSGFFLVLPQKDQSGRPIFFKDLTKFDFNHETSLLRCCWYLGMNTVEDQGAQMKGICNITYCGNGFTLAPSTSTIIGVFKKAGELLGNLPIRNTSYHFCYNNPAMDLILSMVRMAFGKQIRLRMKPHFGSNIEIQYSLLTYGITIKSILETDKAGQVGHRRILNEYLQKRTKLEKTEKETQMKQEIQSGIVLHPESNDVLVGRGRPYQDFCGNLQFTVLVDSFIDKYIKVGDRFERSCMFMDVIRAVHASNGRFLNKINGGWEVVSERVAREKVSGSFRSKASKRSNNASVATVRPSSSTQEELASATPSKRLKYGDGSSRVLGGNEFGGGVTHQSDLSPSMVFPSATTTL